MKKTFLDYSKFAITLVLFLQMGKMNAQSCSTIVNDTFPTSGGQTAAQYLGWYASGGGGVFAPVEFYNPQGAVFQRDWNTYSQLNKDISFPAGATITLKGVSWRNNIFATAATRVYFYVKVAGATFLTIDTQGAGTQPSVVANNGASVNVSSLPSSSGLLSWTTPIDITITTPIGAGTWSLELALQAGSSLASADDVAVQGVVVGTTTPTTPTTSSITQPSCTPNSGSIVFNTQLGIEYSINNGASYQSSNTFAGLGGGTYTLIARRAGTSCVSGTTPVTLVTKTVPVPNAGADFTKTCVTNPTGAPIGATAVGGVTYSWSPATGLTDANLSNPFANPSSTTTYTVTAKNTASGCTATDQVVATVNTTPPAAPTLSATTIANVCPATSVNLNSLVTSATTNLKWYKELTHTTELTTPTAVNTTGTYYPFNVATGNGCYSAPTSSAVNATVSVCCAATTAPNLTN